ncbi:MAG: c-type cytochrome [Balneolaceae bacterium]|nr:c-type cytochrome [Balneolaceae bacterium]
MTFISFFKTGPVIIFYCVAFLISGCSSETAQTEHWPFTPEVEEFVEIYAEAGGEKLEIWMGNDTTPEPQESLEAFEPIDGLAMQLVASEPLIRQPIDLHFDERGRLWVVQYRQYPFPAGVTINFYDQYMRAGFDGVPQAPPNHTEGSDVITVLEDSNGDGVFDSAKDVITGLNITTSVLTGGGGIWVMNPPYLLFYPDRNGNGLPDGDPEVRLEGFGLEDTHSLASSLTWGPDGWIYGVHGSTSTAEVRGIRFLGQAVWRYHPVSDEFELFTEGGGNPWTLSFDSKGRAFSGHNGGNTRGFHWVQGGRYDKNWPKHGPFTRPYSFGSFPVMEHEGYSARFSMTFTVYEEGKLPGFEGQLISGMAMTSRVQASDFFSDGSTFRTVDSDSLVMTSDRSFRPVDTKAGPDGAVYFADWCDIRMDHLDPRDTWDKSCGRIWRLQSENYQPVRPFNLAEKSSEELMELLGDERKWYREQARRLIGERKETSLLPRLQQQALDENGQLALESLWTANLIGGMDPEWAAKLIEHSDSSVRAWAIRLIGDHGVITDRVQEALIKQAGTEQNPEVRSQLASTARYLPAELSLGLISELNRLPNISDDKHIPLLIWWALEEIMTTEADAVMTWLENHEHWHTSLFREHLAERIARRLAAERGDNPSFTRIDPYDNWIVYANYPRSRMPDHKGDYTEWETNYTPEVSEKNLNRLARLLETTPDNEDLDNIFAGITAGLSQGPALVQVPESLISLIEKKWNEQDQSGPFLYAAAQLGYPDAVEKIVAITENPDIGEAERARVAGLVTANQGREAYLTHCALCHQADGSGMERLATPLRNSEWVLGPEEALIRIVLNGFQGEMAMPPMETLSDEELTDILTYIRSAWGHDAGSVSSSAIEKIRAESDSRSGMWTREELSELADEE